MKAGILIRHASTYELGLLVRVFEHRMAPDTDFCDVIWDDGEITTHPARELTANLELPPWMTSETEIVEFKQETA